MAEDIKSTTIKISDKTKQRLEHLKEHKEESFDTLINKAVNILNLCKRSPGLAARILKDIDKSIKRKELLENPEKAIKKKPANSMPQLQQKILNAQQNMQLLRK